MPPALGTAEPYFIPGYTGYCPQYLYRIGDTYGHTTHKLLLDPKVNHAEKVIISERTTDDFQVYRPHQQNIDIVNKRYRYGDAVYKHPIQPGYEGFVPRLNGKFGQRYTVLATEALSEMEEQQMKNRLALLQISKHARSPDDLETVKQNDQLVQSEFRLPLLEVRPQVHGILRNVPVDEPATPSPYQSHIPSPYFKDSLDPEKSFIPGYAGHIPYGYSRYGEGYGPYTNSALCDFTSNYRRRQSTEWAPITVVKPDPPLVVQPTQLYHKHIGMLPDYQGHIPGSIFRFGKTYGNDSRDAKRWLRGDFN